MKIIVKPTSANLWWGIYGLTEKIGWEDLILFHENGERIGGVCLSTKQYLKATAAELRDELEDADFVKAVDEYLKDSQLHYWYYYSDEEKGSEDFYEVSYAAPKNSSGIKPSSLEIWHPTEGIGISTIKSAIKAFAKKFLAINDCEVQIDGIENFAETLKSFRENEILLGGNNPIKIKFSPELISELSNLWNKSEAHVLTKLKKAIK